ncbi:MAG: tail fiber domain-containing protein, partial [Verrucomicrobiota bacterium]
GTTSVGSIFNVNGGVSIGSGFVGTAAPANGAIIQGNVGIGMTEPISPLQVSGNLTVGSGSAGSPGNIQLTTGGGSPISNRLTFGTDGSGWKFAISKNQAGTVSDLMVIADNGNATLVGTLTQSSDIRLKRDIVPIGDALKKVVAINGVTFYWKDRSRDQNEQIGVIAQNVEKIFPQAVTTDVKTDIKSVNYGGLVAPLIEAVKELKSLFDTDHEALAKLKADNDNLRDELKSSEAANDNEATQIKTLTARLDALEAAQPSRRSR